MYYGIPVNEALIACMRDYYCDGVSNAFYPFSQNPFSEQVTSYFFEQIDGMQAGVYADCQTLGHLFGVFREYLTGTGFDDAYEHVKKQHHRLFGWALTKNLSSVLDFCAAACYNDNKIKRRS